MEADCFLLPLSISPWLSCRAVCCPERCQCLPPARAAAPAVLLPQRAGRHPRGHRSEATATLCSSPPTSTLPADHSSALEGRPFLPTATAMIQLSVSSHAITVTVTSSWLVSPPQFPLFQCVFCTAARDISL